MIMAWIITIALFLLCLSFTVIITDGIKKNDEEELKLLQSQYKNSLIKETLKMKKVS
jgi:hypothetical protein